ncbi:MAG: hypothetical protein JOS17DRAFT_572063 [Linnemannia elongata]|nr:MAG: hypothetical protein JOS17DRAFT_572063 [Linnemannia elongata]
MGCRLLLTTFIDIKVRRTSFFLLVVVCAAFIIAAKINTFSSLLSLQLSLASSYHPTFARFASLSKNIHFTHKVFFFVACCLYFLSLLFSLTFLFFSHPFNLSSFSLCMCLHVCVPLLQICTSSTSNFNSLSPHLSLQLIFTLFSFINHFFIFHPHTSFLSSIPLELS